jgi:GGDEF domain-containing protein
MNHIVNNLWLGSQQDADDLVRNNPENITAILNVRGADDYDPPGRDQSAEHPGKAYKWIPAPDIEIIYARHVKEGVAWLREQTDKGERILIHCKHGLSRSAGFLVAYMVECGISSSPEEAKATIAAHRTVYPATLVVESVRPAVVISPLTGLPNRKAFDQWEASAFVALVEVDRMKTFHDFYGPMASDAFIRRLAKILIDVGLDAYHDQGDQFLCKGAASEELNTKLSKARRIFGQPFQVYGGGHIQTIEGMDFSYGIGATPEEGLVALNHAKQTIARKQTPEWMRRVLEMGGPDKVW